MGTILNCLKVGWAHMKMNSKAMRAIGDAQLHHSIRLLERGYDLEDDIDEITARYESLDHVPPKGKKGKKDK